MEVKTIVRPDPDVVARLVARICGDYGERAVTTQAVREHHSHGEGLADAGLPDVVVFPRSNDEVAAIVRLCHLSRVPVIAFGVGTSLEGHVAALYGGVCIDLSQMNRVLDVNAEDLDCRVQAGVTREQLNAELKGTGLFFPIDPGANATIGGMASTRASGTNAVRYGTMRENVMGLTVVTADGRVIGTGGRARKSSAGYDLTPPRLNASFTEPCRTANNPCGSVSAWRRWRGRACGSWPTGSATASRSPCSGPRTGAT